MVLWWLLVDVYRYKSRPLPNIGLGLDFNMALARYLARRDHAALAKRFEAMKARVEDSLGLSEGHCYDNYEDYR